MPSYQFSRNLISLYMSCDTPGQPLSESNVRNFVRETVKRTLDYCENPYYQARNSDVHTFGSWSGSIPVIHDEEDLEASENIEQLVEWIMQTDEMQDAIRMFKGETSESPMEDEQIGLIQVDNLLADLIPTEADYQ